MNLTVVVDGTPHRIRVPDNLLVEAADFFQKMDTDMNGGWQMSRTWVPDPNPVQRCQIATNKLLTAMETGNERLALLMAGYVLWKMPGVRGVEADTTGEMSVTQFITAPNDAATVSAGSPAPELRPIRSRLDAVEQAGQDIGPVYPSGRGYRFARYDHAAGRWQESELAKTRAEATSLRLRAYEQRLHELIDAMPPS